MIQIDAAALDRARQLLAACPGEVDRAARAAINRALIRARTQVSRTVRGQYYAAASDIKKTLAISRPSGKAGGVLRSTGRPLALSAFRVKAPKTGPLRLAVLRRHSARPVPGLFFNTAGGRRRLLMRKGSPVPPRLPVDVPHGPSVPQMVGSPVVLEAVTKDTGDFLNKRFLHEIDYRLSRLGGTK